MSFERDTVSDQKRFVRGEHWLAARNALRARDKVHHAEWRVLIVAGPCPEEEIRCIRALMPRAEITAVDLVEENVAKAKAAGADVAFVCDLAGFRKVPRLRQFRDVTMPPLELSVPFDVVCLDLTGPADERLEKMVTVYSRVVTNRGAMIVTFSYGRDVVEAIQFKWLTACNQRFGQNQYVKALKLIEGMPDSIMSRVYVALGSKVRSLVSVLQYSGHAMPMVSCLVMKTSGASRLPAAKFAKVDQGDFEAAVTAENIGDIYACPQDRILALRRSKVAMKAVATRRARSLVTAAEANLRRAERRMSRAPSDDNLARLIDAQNASARAEAQQPQVAVYAMRSFTATLETRSVKIEAGKTYYDDGTEIFDVYVKDGLERGWFERCSRRADTIVVGAHV